MDGLWAMSDSSETDKKRPEDGPPWALVIAVGSLVSVLAGGLIAIGVWHGPSSMLRLEFAKAGLNLIVLAVLGAGVTAAVQRRAGLREQRWQKEAAAREERWRKDAADREQGWRKAAGKREQRWREEAERRDLKRTLEAESREQETSLQAEGREEQRQREAERREEGRKAFADIQEARRQDSAYALTLLRDIIANYNRLKAARRAMRAVGLDKPEPEPVSADQAAEYKHQMQVLGEVQLAFEGVARELDTRLDQEERDDTVANGEPAPAEYQIAIERLASYVERLVREWEQCGRAAADGNDPDAIRSQKHLTAFLRSSRTDPRKEFRANAAEPLRALQLFFRKRLIVPLLTQPTSVESATSVGDSRKHDVEAEGPRGPTRSG